MTSYNTNINSAVVQSDYFSLVSSVVNFSSGKQTLTLDTQLPLMAKTHLCMHPVTKALGGNLDNVLLTEYPRILCADT